MVRKPDDADYKQRVYASQEQISKYPEVTQHWQSLIAKHAP